MTFTCILGFYFRQSKVVYFYQLGCEERGGWQGSTLYNSDNLQIESFS